MTRAKIIFSLSLIGVLYSLAKSPKAAQLDETSTLVLLILSVPLVSIPFNMLTQSHEHYEKAFKEQPWRFMGVSRKSSIEDDFKLNARFLTWILTMIALALIYALWK